MSASELTLAAVHFAEDCGLLLALGAIVVRRLGRMAPRIGWVEPSMGNGLLLAAVGGTGVLAAEHSWLVLIRLVAEVAGWVLCLRGIPLVAPLPVLAAALLALTGHAARVFPPAGAELVDVLHVLSAGMWGGGIIALATLRPPQGWSSSEARMLLDRFGHVATIAFGVTALTGLLRATESLSALDQLWATPYGITLMVKVAGVLIMLALAGLWRRGHSMGAVDAAVAVSVVLATSLLAAFPPPA